MIKPSCTGVNHCGNARTCQRCAHIRQAKIADAAEALEDQHGQLTLTVLVPEKNTQDEIRRLRASFIRRALAPAGIWTVETGEAFAGLHLNILSPKPAPARWRNCNSYQELVRCTSREAAAYIAKQAGMPPVQQYSGNMSGNFGQLFSYLSSNHAHPVVQAVAIEVTMTSNKTKKPKQEDGEMNDTPTSNPAGWERRNDLYDESKPPSYVPNRPDQCNPPYTRKEKTKEERAEIMRKHLPNLYAAIKQPAKIQEKPRMVTVDDDIWEEGRE
jgi:hypothetical protein